jgi:hypothetical protein
MTTEQQLHNWWASLKHGGVLIAPSKLGETYSEEPEALPDWQADKLRRAINRFESDSSELGALMDYLLIDLVGFQRNEWQKQTDIGSEYTERVLGGERLKPRRLWLGQQGEQLPVFVAEQRPGHLESRLGVGRGKRITSRVLEWLRKRKQPLALITNGSQWRLVHAGSDYEAWCEWDLSFWFVEGEPGPQVTAWRQLMQPGVWLQAKEDLPSQLLKAILDSRKGQAELSSVLGERVRQSVELLITASQGAVESHRAEGVEFDNRALYLAATRIVMRCIVLFFAEARMLLPIDNRLYQSSYSLEGLRQQLDRRAGGRSSERLKQSRSAWPRLVSLFNLVYEGSAHQALTVPEYNGGLFEPGKLDSEDAVLRAIGVLEQAENAVTDAHIHKLLRLITRTRVKVRQGRSATWIEAPVDFSDLSSEYIGILYEGLLDFELKQAVEGEAMLFLAVGKEPVLPLSRLEAMDDKAIANLFAELKKKDSTSDAGDEDAELAAEEAEPEDDDQVEESADEFEISESAIDETDEDEVHAALMQRANDWLLRAVDIAKLAKKPRGRSQLATQEYEKNRQQAARRLIGRLVEPGEFYLVRWGGTRKGAGTFYTRPQLAAPTVRRTLQPLAYDPVRTQRNEHSGLEDVVEWTPKTPEDILNLKVCDPAMGSGSFLASSLRFLTQALLESLYHHDRLARKEDGAIARLADGLPIDHPSQQTLPVPLDHETFDDQLRARLKLHIVERCIYGVDMDPLAVELGRMTLWVETMDRSLPFGFLDHKLKVGNSLVGAWLDNFRFYPAMSWTREGGDKDYQKNKPDNLNNHFFVDAKGKKKGDRFTQAIKEKKNSVKEQLIALISGQLEMGDQTEIDALHGQLEDVFQRLHELPVHDTEERARVYQEEIIHNAAYHALKDRLDLWCSLWFWPGEDLDGAPLPKAFLTPEGATLTVVKKVAQTQRFFHWELEFPDVFTPHRAGFDSIVGNPPWEIQKPNSKEFFSNIDPFYRAYGKQEALSKQLEYFAAEPEVEHNWIAYMARLKSLSNWVKYAGHPFGNRVTINSNGKQAHDFGLGGRGAGSFQQSSQLHDKWARERKGASGYADHAHPYRHQGSADLNTYKLFLELAHSLLHEHGRLGFIAPSGIYTDKGTTQLRELFLNSCDWQWLFGFENREGIFDIHRSFKFCPLIIEKGSKTEAIRAAFMHRNVDDWDSAEDRVLGYPRERVEQFSPYSKAILEIRSDRDLAVLTKLYANGVLLGDQSENGWGIKYATEFHMTNDSKLFPGREKWEQKGYAPDEYGHWLKGPWQSYDGSKSILERGEGLILSRNGTRALKADEIEDVALPVYNAKMFSTWDFSSSGWVSGKGRGAVWESITSPKYLSPEYLMARDVFKENSELWGMSDSRLVFKDISTAVHQRTMMNSIVPPFPAVNACPILFPQLISETSLLQANLASFVLDYVAKYKIGYLHLNYFIIAELPVLTSRARSQIEGELQKISTALSCGHEIFANVWRHREELFVERAWKKCWALSDHERLRLKVISDCLIAFAYCLDLEELAWVLRETTHPVAILRDRDSCAALDQKAFWRVDKLLDPELRQTVLTQICYADLLARGLEDFLVQNNGEGWMLPETIRLADFGLGRDERAKEQQPVASRLGPRFHDWQLEQDVDESWEECRQHAELINMIVPPPADEADEEIEGVAESPGQYQTSLDL